MNDPRNTPASAGERLDRYLQSTRARLRAFILARASLCLGAALLVICVAAVWMLQRDGFPSAAVAVWRVGLLLALAAIVFALLWRPLAALRRAHGATELERHLPAQQGRIDTWLEMRNRADASGARSPILDLLAQDALQVAAAPAGDLAISRGRVMLIASVALAVVLTLVVLLALPDSPWGYGGRHLLLGIELPRSAVPVRSLAVAPGDATLRRNGDLRIRATPSGFAPAAAQVFVRFADSRDWERAPMQRGQQGGFDFTLYALRAPLQYYVVAGSVRSLQHSVRVVDLPRVESIRLTYTHPSWTDLAQRTEDETRDIRAVEGTRVTLEVKTDKPLDSPALIVDGVAASLAAAGASSSGTLQVLKAGRYHIAARVANEVVALTDDYAIDVIEDEKPTVEIVKPGRDARASAIEEVPVRIKAADDFRLQGVELRFSVNGGRWQTAGMEAGKRETDGAMLLQLEQLGNLGKPLVPGDLISYYASARDRAQTAQTDLFMVQVQAFDRRFTQGQAGGGGGDGGGGADEQNQISERQKEILLATWNLQRARSSTDATRNADPPDANSARRSSDSARMLGELQATLAQQTRTLAQRTRARSQDDDPQVEEFVGHLDNAAAAMDPAAKQLAAINLNEAIPVEQQALQHLQRAEATFREIQVSRNSSAGGGGGGGGQQAADISELFELEMDLNKNQYETQTSLANNAEAQQEQVSEAVRRLKELAERQEKLAEEARRQAANTPEQKWKQEQLRRDVEEMKRKLEQLARQERQQQGSQQQDGQSGGQRSGSASGSTAGSSGSSAGAAQQALASVQNALERMRNDQPPDENTSRELRRALQQLDRPGGERMAGALEQAAERAAQLADQQRGIQGELQDALGDSQRLDRERTAALGESKEKLLAELTDLEQQLRQTAQANRAAAPQSARRVNEILDQLDASGAQSRLSRSIDELRFGRTRELAPREGIVTEALESLESDLRETAAGAGRESLAAQNGADPQELLAQLGELRRALDEAQRQAALNQPGKGAPSEARQGQQGEAAGRGEDGDENGGLDAGRGGRDERSGGGIGDGLAAWNAIGRGSNGSVAIAPLIADRETLRQGLSRSPQAAALARELAQLEARARDGRLSREQLDALRRLNRGVRTLRPGSMAEQADVMRRLINQMEMLALASAEKARKDQPARAAVPAPDSPAYREAAAEYYRRLGGS